jgi:hypothetical protein
MEKKSRTMDKLSYYDALGPSAGITVTRYHRVYAQDVCLEAKRTAVKEGREICR